MGKSFLKSHICCFLYTCVQIIPHFIVLVVSLLVADESKSFLDNYSIAAWDTTNEGENTLQWSTGLESFAISAMNQHKAEMPVNMKTFNEGSLFFWMLLPSSGQANLSSS